MITNRNRLPYALVFLIALSGCSAATQQQSGVSRNIDLLTREEVTEANRSSAYEVIEMLRPQWLQARSAQSVNRQGGGVIVYMDDVRYGDLDSLRSIHSSGIFQMERFNATAASQRWGPGHSEGVIVISTRAPAGD
jgi:hypothetical protein